jgi:hypothetical protein
MIEEILRELGVRIVSVSGDELCGYCPVHVLVEGVDQSKPKWYINAESGAWICFTCGQRGSLPHLVEALGGDAATIEKLKLSASLDRLATVHRGRRRHGHRTRRSGSSTPTCDSMQPRASSQDASDLRT